MGPAVAQAELSLLTWCVCVGGGLCACMAHAGGGACGDSFPTPAPTMLLT